MLISHNHIDHHWPPFTVRFLLNNPKAVVVTTPEVRGQMKKDSPEFEKVESRVVVPELEWKQSTDHEINGIRLEIARLKHGEDKEWSAILYAYLFELGGKKVLSAPGTTGYFPDEYRTPGYATRGIDLAFLDFDLMIRQGAAHPPGSAAVGGKSFARVAKAAFQRDPVPTGTRKPDVPGALIPSRRNGGTNV